jgi:hypothetical protein
VLSVASTLPPRFTVTLHGDGPTWAYTDVRAQVWRSATRCGLSRWTPGWAMYSWPWSTSLIVSSWLTTAASIHPSCCTL